MTIAPLRTLGLLLAIHLAACSSTRVTTPTDNSGAAPPANDAGETRPPSSLTFVATYPATLLYALDGAAGERNHDEGYRAWIVGDAEPQWIQDYARRRKAWGARRRPDAGGGAPAFDVCGWTAPTLDEAIACLEDVVPEADRPTLRTALREADKMLSPKWPEIEAHLATLMPELEAKLASPDAAYLTRILRREASLPDETPIHFQTVLVGKPPGSHSYARQTGEYLLHEVDEKDTAGSLLGTAFHEMAHLVHSMSPVRNAFEEEFMPLGDHGRLAANVWDEVVATAFGNGLAAEKFDPSFSAKSSFYADAPIDALGHALYENWKAGVDVRLDRALAERLTEWVDTSWPTDENSVGRYLWTVTVSAQDRTALEGALEGVRYRAASRTRPIDDRIAAAAGFPPWSPRVVLATSADLVAHPALVARVTMPAGSWEPALDGHRGAVFRRTESDGTILFVVVAPDVTALRIAMPAFTRLPRMVDEGWTSW